MSIEDGNFYQRQMNELDGLRKKLKAMTEAITKHWHDAEISAAVFAIGLGTLAEYERGRKLPKSIATACEEYTRNTRREMTHKEKLLMSERDQAKNEIRQLCKLISDVETARLRDGANWTSEDIKRWEMAGKMGNALKRAGR